MRVKDRKYWYMGNTVLHGAIEVKQGEWIHFEVTTRGGGDDDATVAFTEAQKELTPRQLRYVLGVVGHARRIYRITRKFVMKEQGQS